MNRVKAFAATGIFIGAIVAANWLTARYGIVPVGFGFEATAGTYAAGLALLARDFIQKYASKLWVVIALLVGIGLSWLLASPALAVASAVAFALSEIMDFAVFSRLRSRGFVCAALVSNVISAPLDTIVFLSIAGFPLTVETFVGQVIGKLLWATVIPLLIFWVVKRALLRQPINSSSPRRHE